MVEPDTEATETVRTLSQVNDLLERKYPRLFEVGISEGVLLLPSGQLMNLWMTLHHNFFDGSCKHLATVESTEEGRTFFMTLSNYFCEFLSGVRLESVPQAMMEKVRKWMKKFRNECLATLSQYLVENKYDNDTMTCFLKLGLTWSELHGLLLHYHQEKYEVELPLMPSDATATNLEYLHPYLTSTQWGHLETQVNTFGDSLCKDLFVDLVAQKLKFFKIFTKDKYPPTNYFVAETISNCTVYICGKLQWNSWRPDLYSFLQSFLSDSEIYGIVCELVERIPSMSTTEIVLPVDASFHYALVLEGIDALLRTCLKMNTFKKELKKIKKKVSEENRRQLRADSCEFIEIGESSKKILEDLLESTNDLITTAERCGVTEVVPAFDFSTPSILSYAEFLSLLPVNDYPKTLKTVVFLTSLSTVIAASLLSIENSEVLDSLVLLFCQSSAHSIGNEFIFGLNWLALYKWFLKNMEKFSLTSKRTFVRTIFANVYISAKSVGDFREQLETLTTKIKITSPVTCVALSLLEFLVQELQAQAKSKIKSKLGPLMQGQLQDLVNAVSKSLKKLQKSQHLESDYSHFGSNSFQASWLLQSAVKALQAANHTNSLNLERLMKIYNIQAEAALNLIQCKSEVGILNENEHELLCRRYALGFLVGVCKSKEFPPGFISKLWKAYTLAEVDLINSSPSTNTEIPCLCARDLYEAASTKDFEEIMQDIITRFDSLAVETMMNSSDDAKLGRTAQLLCEILDAELTPEKKTIRRHGIEEILYASLAISAEWSNSSLCYIARNIIPFIQFEVNLLRRRSALCSTKALSLCLTSITCIPLNTMEKIKPYRSAFCVVADLLNAFTIHRLDVLSFRIHIYLQCFQFLLESLRTKADQSLKLRDDEISDLRYCAHAIERICQSMKLGQIEFSRISSYLLAILIRQFELTTIYPAVKDPLLSGCYKLLDICDGHGISQLNSMFTLGSREIFKTVYDVYKKFYRYGGKV